MLDLKLLSSEATEWYHTTWLTAGLFDMTAFDFRDDKKFIYPLDTWL
jgi:hypothetical protein